MGLMDEFTNERYGPPIKCSVHVLAKSMEDADKADFLKAVDDGIIPAKAIERVLERRGIRLAAPAVTRHRRGECGCGK